MVIGSLGFCVSHKCRTYCLKGAEIHPITYVAVMLCFFLLGHWNVVEAFLEKKQVESVF